MMLKIYHNPRCSKSRQALALIQEQGLSPQIIEYLKFPFEEMEIIQLAGQLKLGIRKMLRKNENAYKELELANSELTDQQLIQAIIDHPGLLQRPIVTNQGRAVIGRPPEKVLTIL